MGRLSMTIIRQRGDVWLIASRAMPRSWIIMQVAIVVLLAMSATIAVFKLWV
jgi:hypothetical protein